MKLKDCFISHNYGDESMLVPTHKAEFSGIVNGNGSFGFILDCLKEDVTEAGIVDKMEEKYDAPRSVLEDDVRSVLEKLRGIGAIDE